MSKYKFETSKGEEESSKCNFKSKKEKLEKNKNKNKKTPGQTELPGENPEQQIASRVVKLHDL